MTSTGAVAAAALAAVGGLIGGLMLRASYRRLRRAKRTGDAESSSIGDLSPDAGRVSVTGTVEDAAGNHTAHIADTEAVVVQTEAGRYHESANVDTGPELGDGDRVTSGGSYNYRQKGVRAAPFEIADETGSIRVTAGDGAVDTVLEPSAHADVGSVEEPQDPVASAVGATEDLLLGSQTDRLREGVLHVGDEATVQGVPVDAGSELVVAAGDVPLLVTDGDADSASEKQAEGWVGYFLLGVLFLAGSSYLAFLILL